MRVLMLVSEAPPIKSGIARVAGELTDRLRRLGVHVDVISANEIPRASFKEFRFSSLAPRWLQIQKKLGDYDILHVHGSVPTFSDVALLLGRLGTRFTKRLSAVVYTHHCDIDLEGLDLPVDIYNSIHHKLIRLADHVVASTPSYALQLDATLRPGRVSAVPFGVNADQFVASTHKPDRFNVLFVGQLRPYKGVDVLLRAWQKLDNADLHIVGTGHEQANLTEMVEELGLKSVHLHGSVNDQELSAFYANAHVLVLPSTRKAEAFGLVLLEGMASGCVPIASQLPGVTDVVGTGGLTFPVNDSDALAELLIELRDNPELREQKAMLAEARSIVFDWDYTAQAYYNIYKQAYVGRALEVTIKDGLGGTAATPEMLQEWLKELMRHADADRATLMLRPRGGKLMRIAASVNVDPDVVADTALPVGQRIAGYVAQTGRPMLIRKRGMPAIARLYKRDTNLTSSIVLPLRLGKRTIGVLNLARTQERFAFNDADRRWLHRLGYQIALTLRSYRQLSYGMAAPSINHESRRVDYRQAYELTEQYLIAANDMSETAVLAQVDEYAGQAFAVPAVPAASHEVGSSSAVDYSDIISMVTDGWAGYTPMVNAVERVA